MKLFEWNYQDYLQFLAGNPKTNGLSRYINDHLTVFNPLCLNSNTNLLINTDYKIINSVTTTLIETYIFTTYKDVTTLGVINFQVSYNQITDPIDPTKTTITNIYGSIVSTGIYKKYSKLIGNINYNNDTGARIFSLSCP